MVLCFKQVYPKWAGRIYTIVYEYKNHMQTATCACVWHKITFDDYLYYIEYTKIRTRERERERERLTPSFFFMVQEV